MSVSKSEGPYTCPRCEHEEVYVHYGSSQDIEIGEIGPIVVDFVAECIVCGFGDEHVIEIDPIMENLSSEDEEN